MSVVNSPAHAPTVTARTPRVATAVRVSLATDYTVIPVQTRMNVQTRPSALDRSVSTPRAHTSVCPASQALGWSTDTAQVGHNMAFVNTDTCRSDHLHNKPFVSVSLIFIFFIFRSFFFFFFADVDECLYSPTPCANGRCENTAGSYKCACRSGFRLQGNTCGGETAR